MKTGLTARQTQILKALIDEYINTASAVGSEVLEKKYNLGVSSATIRNEMMELTRLGFLRQPHTSAGRVPTPAAMKFYIGQLMEEKQMSVTDEVKAKEEVWDSRNDLEALMAEATQALAHQTKSLAISALDDDGLKVWHSGLANVFTNPEFENLQVCANLFGMLEEVRRIHELFFERASVPQNSTVQVIFGEELGWPGFAPVGIVSTRINVAGKNAALGVIGPTRLAYPTIIPTLRYFGSLLSEVAGR